MNTQDKPTNLEEQLDDILLDYLNNHGREAIAIEQIMEALSDLVTEALPEEKRNTRGTTQNPNNPNYLTKSATAYNQCLADIKSNLAQRGFIVGGEDE